MKRLAIAKIGLGAVVAAVALTACGAAQTPGKPGAKAETTPVACTATLATPSSAAKPDAPPADPAAAPPSSPTAAPPAGEVVRLYMPDGQLISHGLTIYVNADLHASQDLQLKLFRNHAITDVQDSEEKTLLPALVASGQQWAETFQGRQIYPTGTILIFDTHDMSFDGRAMARVRPLLTWKDNGVERCAVGAGEVNVGDIVFATAYTAGAVLAAILLIVVLAKFTKERKSSPVGLLMGVDGHLSLSQTQIGCWTILVGGVVLGYGMIRREIPEIPESLLVLMGTSLVTGGLAYFQDAKNAGATAAATGKQVTARSWALGDLIRVFSDDQEPELSLAKAQMLFWTILLLLLFVSKSILEGQIWPIPWPLVALMGFSQAGYLVPKVANPAAASGTTGAKDPLPPSPPAGPPPAGQPPAHE